jgi:gamma-glutamyl:cysteine ligase YbdK (ATP-grasp superfamily)
MKIIRTTRNKKDTLGMEISIQTITGQTHSLFSEQEEIIGKLLDKVRKAAEECLKELEETQSE